MDILWNTGILLAAGIQDLRTKSIPRWLLAVFFVGSVFLAFYQQEKTLSEMFAGGMVGCIIFIVSLFTRGQIGKGDAYLLVGIGILLGFWETTELLLWGLLLAALFGLSLLLFAKKEKTTEMPFVPFLLVAYLAREVLL